MSTIDTTAAYAEMRARLLDTGIDAHLLASVWAIFAELETEQVQADQARTLADSVLKDAQNLAEYVTMAGIMTAAHELLTPVACALWDAGGDAIQGERDSVQIRVGHVLMLDALATSPDALLHMVRGVRARLVNADPALAQLAQPVIACE